MPFFDNVDDLQTKFVSTICMYDGQAVFVKQVAEKADKRFTLFIVNHGKYTRGKHIELTDPAFNYVDFNIGYANYQKRCVWWYRKPIRQYRQGLKSEQMGYRNPGGMYMDDLVDMANFGISGVYVNMLENNYPHLNDCKLLLDRDDGVKSIAFHCDFAISYDDMHNDYIMEYCGTKIGTSHNLIGFNLKPEYKHLTEALREAANVQ